MFHEVCVESRRLGKVLLGCICIVPGFVLWFSNISSMPQIRFSVFLEKIPQRKELNSL